ncbi:cell wall hydrolase [Sneathiella sp.]|uniref:cell wall hydrolase n=1 Tax=Sneathiella sp. TaxID=1964365 RepID=UPI0039E5E941
MSYFSDRRPAVRSYRTGLALGIVAVLLLTATSFSLLFQFGAADREIQNKYLAAKYSASTNYELERKLAEVDLVQGSGHKYLKDLDMPVAGNVEATLENVDLFERVFSKDELCLTQAVYFEARGEPLIGQVAIAEVVLNRVADRKYPDNACKVVFQNKHMPNRCQFSFACDGKPDRPSDLNAWEKSLKIVALVMAGERSGVAKRATHYHASYVSPNWRLRLNKVGEIGRHIFYRDRII